MFCHLTLQGRPAPKRKAGVGLTSSQSRLSSSVRLVKWWWWGLRFTIRNMGKAHSFCASLHMSPKEEFFLLFFFLRTAGPALPDRGKQRSGIGWARLIPLVKWCWHAEGLLWEVVIHHDFRMTQKQHSAFGVMVWIHDWCEVHVFVGKRSEKETCFYVLNISKNGS